MLDLVGTSNCWFSHAQAQFISDVYRNVKSNFLAKVPSVLFDSPCGRVHCEISVNSDLAYYTSRLLEVYSKVDPRVRQLAVIFRHWAKVMF